MCNYILSCWKQAYRQGLYSWSEWLPFRFALLWSAAFWELFYPTNPAFLLGQLWKAFPRSPTGVGFESWTCWVAAPRARVSGSVRALGVPQLITQPDSDKLRARARARNPQLRHAQVLQIKEFVKKWSKNWYCKILLRITTLTDWNLQNLSWQCWFPASQPQVRSYNPSTPEISNPIFGGTRKMKFSHFIKHPRHVPNFRFMTVAVKFLITPSKAQIFIPSFPLEPVHKPKPLLAGMFCNLQKKHKDSIAGTLPLQQAWLTQSSCSHLVIWVPFRRCDFKLKIVSLEWF